MFLTWPVSILAPNTSLPCKLQACFLLLWPAEGSEKWVCPESMPFPAFSPSLPMLTVGVLWDLGCLQRAVSPVLVSLSSRTQEEFLSLLRLPKGLEFEEARSWMFLKLEKPPSLSQRTPKNGPRGQRNLRPRVPKKSSSFPHGFVICSR